MILRLNSACIRGLAGPVSVSAKASRPCFRSYAWSRNPGPRSRVASPHGPPPRTNRLRAIVPTPGAPLDDEKFDAVRSNERLAGSGNAETGLEQLLQNDTLFVVRQVEMMNIFLGFEQANRYALLDPLGNNVGYMAEEDRGLWGVFSRQLFRTHRAFRSVIMDREGRPVLWIHRPFSWINSRIYVQRKIEEDVMVLGEAQQEWHLWRRRYNVFRGGEGDFEQFARVDAPFLSWEFYLQDANDDNVGSIQKNFAGFGREIFTDTGEYAVTFRPDPMAPSALANPEKQAMYRRLSLDERATALALSVGIDFDYFSRHSEGGGGLPLFFWWSSGE